MSNPQPYRRLLRSPDRTVAGVCGGLADYAGVDPTIVRVAAVVLGIFMFPVVPILYLIAWAIIPDSRR
jgi:phage shock protein C